MFINKSLQDVSIFNFFEALSCPRSLTCWLMYVHGEHSQLASLEWDPLCYNTAQSAADSLASTKFLAKATFLETGNDLRENAITKFLEAEDMCRKTNRDLYKREASDGQFYNLSIGTRKLIEDILGSVDPYAIIEGCNWGPGATTKIKRRDSCFPRKFLSETEITKVCYDFVQPWWEKAYPSWVPKFSIRDCSKIVTVPKNAKTDRTIAIEPGINLWLQKGVGTVIRHRLRKFGVDLSRQNHNQNLSRLAAKHNKLATVDFSMASDTISRRTVEHLLPTRWYALLSALRSPYGLLNDTRIVFEKFSSMGNGFTFELETLIFFAAAVTVCKSLAIDVTVSVYGDDVIIPAAAYDLYVNYCRHLGFTTNSSKSYSDGYYRESCGAHWWNGVDIKPIFLRKECDGNTAIIKLANSVRVFSHNRASRNGYSGCDISLYNTWIALVSALGGLVKAPKVCLGYGDAGLICNFDEADGTVSRAGFSRKTHGWEGYFTRVWVAQPKTKYFDCHGLLLTKLQSIGKAIVIDSYIEDNIREAAGLGNETPLPGRITYARKRILIPVWIDIGPWVKIA